VTRGEVRERHVEVLDVQPSTRARAGRGHVDVGQREGACHATLVIGCWCERYARLQAFVELGKIRRRHNRGRIELIVDGREPLQAPLLEGEDKVTVVCDFLSGTELRAGRSNGDACREYERSSESKNEAKDGCMFPPSYRLNNAASLGGHCRRSGERANDDCRTEQSGMRHRLCLPLGPGSDCYPMQTA
jgi:hypothetical protein